MFDKDRILTLNTYEKQTKNTKCDDILILCPNIITIKNYKFYGTSYRNVK